MKIYCSDRPTLKWWVEIEKGPLLRLNIEPCRFIYLAFHIPCVFRYLAVSGTLRFQVPCGFRYLAVSHTLHLTHLAVSAPCSFRHLAVSRSWQLHTLAVLSELIPKSGMEQPGVSKFQMSYENLLYMGIVLFKYTC